ncbi:hypothetical protein HY991_00275 [Candidatus Micrarchaeota archaeon]|nr:hypothetical protein [Candidatus Micrarchaeota archaeon]
MKKKFLFAYFFLIFIGAICATCPNLEVSTASVQAVTVGTNAVYPITLTNHGETAQLFKLSATCPEEMACGFKPVAAYATLGTEESTTFNLIVSTLDAEPGEYSVPVDVSGDSPTPCETVYLVLNATESPVTPPPTAPFSVSIYPGGNFSGLPGEVIKLSLVVQSNLDLRTYARIKTEGNFFDESTAISAAQLTLEPYEKKTVDVSVTIPAGTPGGSYDWVLTVTGIVDVNKFYYQFPVHIAVVSSTVDVQLSNEPIVCIPARHEKEEKKEISIWNRGEATGPFTLSIEASEYSSDAVSLVPEQFELQEGERTFVTISIKPPKIMPLGLHHFYLVGKYLDYLLFKRHYCFTVLGVEDLKVSLPDEFEIKRCSAETAKVRVKNNGTISQNYSVEFTPIDLLSVSVAPNRFELSPGAEKDVNFVVSTNLLTLLKDYSFPVVIRSSTISRIVYLNFSVVSSNKSEQSFLKLDSEDFNVVEGEPAFYRVRVTNTKSTEMRDVRIIVKGISEEWMELESPKSIAGRESREFRVKFTVPTGGAGLHKLSISAVSGLESVTIERTLKVIKAETRYDFNVREVRLVGEGTVTEVILNVDVRNTGNTRVSSIKASAPGYIVSTDYTPLLPGESRQVDVRIKAVDSTPAGSVELKFSGDGVEKTQVIPLPAMKQKQGFEFPGFSFWWKLAIGFLGFVILVFIGRRLVG